MAWETLKAAVTAVITANGNNEITGQILKDLLNNNIIEHLGANLYKGVATPLTNPVTPEKEDYYIAYENGVYANFNGLEIVEELVIFKYVGSAWVKEIILPFGSVKDLYNCHSTQETFAAYNTIIEAREAVPSHLRKRGLKLVFLTNEDGWRTEIFIGSFYVPSNMGYFVTDRDGNSSFAYLGDVTNKIVGSEEVFTCDVGLVAGSYYQPFKKYSRAYYSVLLQKGVTTFTNLLVGGSPLKLTVTEDYALYNIQYNLNFWKGEYSPINNFVKNFPQILNNTSRIENNENEIKTLKDNLLGLKTNLNPLYNVFDEKYIVKDINCGVTFNPQTWSLNSEENAQTLILPLFNYGYDVYLKITGVEQRLYNTQIIFLDKDLVPKENGGSYSVPNTGGGIDINLSSMSQYAHEYIAITFIRGVDFGNTDPAKGYVWTQQEIDAKRPNWYDNVVFNFMQSTSGAPKTVISEKKTIINGDFDVSKINFFNRFLGNFSQTLTQIEGADIVNRFNFLYASDSHIETNERSFNNVKQLIEFSNQSQLNTYLDCVIHGGDVSTPNYLYTPVQADGTYKKYYKEVEKSKKPFIQVVGNHDKHQELNVVFSQAFTDNDVVNYFKTYTNHVASTLYEFTDFADKKIRVIKIDAFNYPLEDNAGLVKYPLTEYDCFMTELQVNWFVTSALNAPQDYNIILATHLYLDNFIVDRLSTILNALKNKTAGSVNFDYSLNGYVNMPVTDFTINFDFTTYNTNYVIGIFTGHTHRDNYRLSNGLHIIGIANQSRMFNFGTRLACRIDNTKTQNCFNMISVDVINKSLYIQRYGFGADLLNNLQKGSDYAVYLDKKLNF